MTTLDDIVAATKIIADESETLMGGASSKPEENGVGFPDGKKDDDGSAAAVAGGKLLIENKTVVEPAYDRDNGLDCGLADQENGGAENLSGVSNDRTSLSVNGVQVPANGFSEDIECELKLKYTEDSSVDDPETQGSPVAEDENDVGNVEDHGFCVGDFVWGKIKSHPWWPGQVYDHKDASDFALKHSQEGRLLVAFFGDGSCSWCSPSQLIPFVQNFAEMSTDSSSTGFVNAVQKAVNEVGGLVEAQMTCKCIPEDRRDGLASPVVTNAGVKSGTLMPEVDVCRLSVPKYNPAELLNTLCHFAMNVYVGNPLELAVFRSRLSAFNRYHGGYTLPLYHEPVYVEGLEDKNKSVTAVGNDFTVPIEVPLLRPRDDDWNSSPWASAAKPLGLSGDKICHRRKHKSVAELMAEDTTVKPKNRRKAMSKQGTGNGSSQKMKRKDGESKRGSGQRDSSTRKKRKIELIESPQRNGDNGNLGNASGPSQEKTEGTEVATAAENGSGDAKEELDNVSSPRERKRSKYLSPPYTDLSWSMAIPSSKIKMELGIETEKSNKRAGARMAKDAGVISGSPPVSGSVENESEDNLPISRLESCEASVGTSPLTVENNWNLTFPISDVDIPVDKLLSNLQSAAINPIYLSKEGSLDLVWAFISAFRSSTYNPGSNYTVLQKCDTDRKRKTLSSQTGNQEKDLVKSKKAKLVDLESPKAMKGTEKLKIQKSSKSSKFASSKSSGDKVAGKDSACLIVAFSPEFPLPLKGDIIKLFQKFGSLNEEETCVSEESHSVHIVFANDSDAETAFVSSLSRSPFGLENVTYKLRHSSAGSRACGSRPNVFRSANDSPKKPGSYPQDNLMSDARAIRQKVEIMTATLENYHTKFTSDDKSNLRDEMQGLLEKIESTSERVRVLAEETSLYRN